MLRCTSGASTANPIASTKLASTHRAKARNVCHTGVACTGEANMGRIINKRQGHLTLRTLTPVKDRRGTLQDTVPIGP